MTSKQSGGSVPASPEAAPSVVEESVFSEHEDHDDENVSRHSTPGPDEDGRRSGSSRIKGPWSKEEDELLASLVAKYGAKKWSVIAEHVPGRIGKQCRERWLNHLDTSVKKGPWTEEEDETLLETQRRIGNRWCEIARMLPGRPENAVKNRFNSLMNKGRHPHEPRAKTPQSSLEPRSPVRGGSPQESHAEKPEVEPSTSSDHKDVPVPSRELSMSPTPKIKEPTISVGHRFLLALGSIDGLYLKREAPCIPLKKDLTMDGGEGVKRCRLI